MEDKIRSIYRDTNFSVEEKSRKVFELLNQYKAPKAQEVTEDKEDKEDKEDEDEDDKEDKEDKECSHYIRQNLIQCPNKDCEKWVNCRLCHDEAVDTHQLDRFGIIQIKCRKCKTIQSTSNECIKCLEQFATYYCDICHIWTGEEIYHCEKCGLCRRGKKENYQHCDICSACMSPEHKCRPDLLSGRCTICQDDLFSTTKPIVQLPCLHAIHQECILLHSKNDFRCPNCNKSIGDLTELWNRISQAVSEEFFPEPYCFWKSEIHCVDCLSKSIVKFHYRFHQCPSCGSYNTDKIRNIPSDDSNNHEDLYSDEYETSSEGDDDNNFD